MILTAPLGLIYGMAVRTRTLLYRSGLLRTSHAPLPVISVGNITVGGTGKTPLVEWIARTLTDEGLSPCVLTRGYGRARARERVLVSDGARVLTDARTGGDEPFLLAEKLLGKAAVISDRDRVAAARWAAENLERVDLFILDDGFQHLRLARDLDLVVVDATDPWSSGLLPFGRRREPLSALARADCFVITRAEGSTSVEGLRRELMRRSGGKPVFVSRTKTLGLRRVDALPQSERPVQTAGPFFAFCGIGNPKAFFAQLGREGYPLVATRAFTDHHLYTQREIERLTQRARACGARALLTTLKDAVKLRHMSFSLPCFALEIELEIEEGAELRRLLRERVLEKALQNKRLR
ncbi:MAG: tetraacyldisaccharide 4'-kinase [Pyrinomonas sp.]|uniref:tetraacyldisaccharide 4'-kinase n=1 Tax=Pyrinomonas sp. TaxID=2080306 RepID=UPI00331688F6